MPHLYVIPGHGSGDPGACANGYSEAERVRALATRIGELGGGGVTLHDFNDDAYRSGALNSLSIPGDWCVVELHMDSAGSSARGGHVIIKDGFSPDAYDDALAGLMSNIFPGRSNLIVGRSDLANPNRAAARGINYRLVENGFISNARDVSTFNGRMDDIARGYLAAFGIGAVTAPPAPHNTPQPTPDPATRGLDVDGVWGPATTSAVQRALGTPVDGVVSDQYSGWRSANPGLMDSSWEWHERTSGGSTMIRALQRKVGAGADGFIGPDTITALQRYLGTYQDGHFDYPSNGIKALQIRLNAGTF